MDPSEPLSKRLPFTSLQTRQWLLLWNCSNREGFWDTRYVNLKGKSGVDKIIVKK